MTVFALPGWTATSALGSCGHVDGALHSIEFTGNRITRPRTMLREMSFRTGDHVDSQAIEHSRQSIQDLRLFKRVETLCAQTDDGITLQIHVDEKFYLIPAPRADANSDGKYAYGAQIRWYNLFGRNHTLKATIKREDRKEVGRGTALTYKASYNWPWLADSNWGLRGDALHQLESVDGPDPSQPAFTETEDTYGLTLLHHLPMRSASQGLAVGFGLGFRNLSNSGASAPPSPGSTIRLLGRAKYEDVRFKYYSETGQEWNLELEVADRTLGSDYSERLLNADYRASWALGSEPHQTLGIYLQAGLHAAGPQDDRYAFDLGGSDIQRGYDRNTLRGDRYLNFGVEYLRPMFWNGLRGVVFVETGRAWAGPPEQPDRWLASAGLGLRIRLTSFVRFELDLGYAFPLLRLNGGDSSAQIYAAGHR